MIKEFFATKFIGWLFPKDPERIENAFPLPPYLANSYCWASFFDSATNGDTLKGFKVGIVVVNKDNKWWARIGVCTQIGGYNDEVDAAFILREGATIDVVAAELILYKHNGRRIYID